MPGQVRGQDPVVGIEPRPQRGEVVVCAADAVQQKQWFAGSGAIPKELACHQSWDTRTGSRSPQRGVDNPHTEHFVTFTLHADRARIDDDRRATHPVGEEWHGV